MVVLNELRVDAQRPVFRGVVDFRKEASFVSETRNGYQFHLGNGRVDYLAPECLWDRLRAASDVRNAGSGRAGAPSSVERIASFCILATCHDRYSVMHQRTRKALFVFQQSSYHEGSEQVQR